MLAWEGTEEKKVFLNSNKTLQSIYIFFIYVCSTCIFKINVLSEVNKLI